MFSKEIIILCITAASIGFFHTIFGPDHYLPFIVMSKARNWPRSKTAFITFVCGLGHVLSSVVIGIVGILFGVTVMRLEVFEGFRGNLAAWALIGFGLAYCLWGVRAAIRNKPHKHVHVHLDSREHDHEHVHVGQHSHPHSSSSKKGITPWVLFTIFVLGPCEPLIPILMYPAAKNSIGGLALVACIFSLVTVLTMIVIVMALSWGIGLASLGKMERYSHAMAGATICISGLAIQFLGL